jgi:uncharacterized protein YndB with AHSA1/START domain
MANDDYEMTIHVNAGPDAVFDALTTVEGLTAWWTAASGSGDTGGTLTFSMNASDPCVMHVDEAIRPTSVRWTVTECNFEPDWVGTRPTFTIAAAADGGSEMHFEHVGLTPDLECIEVCRRGWDHFIPSLRDHVERGEGSPNGSPGDAARREVERSGSRGEGVTTALRTAAPR